MSYRFTYACKVGRSASNIATAPRRAFETERACVARLMGLIAARLSSSAKVSAMCRKKASAFFSDVVARYAEIATRIKTISALGSGISVVSKFDSVRSASDIRARSCLAREQFLTKRGYRAINPVARQCVTCTRADKALSPAGALELLAVYFSTSTSLGPGSV